MTLIRPPAPYLNSISCPSKAHGPGPYVCTTGGLAEALAVSAALTHLCITPLQGTLSLAQLCVTEAAAAAFRLLAVSAREVKHVCGLVFWLVALYANIWVAALAVLALPSWIALGMLMFQVPPRLWHAHKQRSKRQLASHIGQHQCATQLHLCLHM